MEIQKNQMDMGVKFCADCEYYKPGKRKKTPSGRCDMNRYPGERGHIVFADEEACRPYLEFVEIRAEVQKRFARPSVGA